jgi:hypothetical protein
MKKILLLLVCLPIIGVGQNLPTIYSESWNEERYFEWDPYIKERLKELQSEIDAGDNDGPFYGELGDKAKVSDLWWSGGCDMGGVYCKNASSTLIPQGKNNYSVNNINDSDPRTAWVEGKSGYGIGESFEMDWPVHIAPPIQIFNGYQKSIKAWKDNSRVKKFKIYINNKEFCYLVLEDKMNSQSFELEWRWEDEENEWDDAVVRFEIVEVYKGDRWSDVAISGTEIISCCFTQNTSILNSLEETSISDIKKGSKISLINLESDKIEETGVVRGVKVIHNKILKIKTLENQIEITPDHPLYIKGYGLSSLYKVKRLQKKKSYSDLINNVEVLVWNKDIQKSEYVRLTDIQVLKGNFDTYNILEMEKGKNFIANGFITSVY